jgi:8-oxo-dGTP diphosphatase
LIYKSGEMKKLPWQRNPYLVIDIIIEKNGKIVLIERNKEPFKNTVSIPGGFVEWGETVEAAVVREAKEETSLKVKPIGIVGVYSNPKRDPRGHLVSIVWAAEVIEGKLKAASDAKDAMWYSLRKIPFRKIKYDHDAILRDYLKWKKNKGTCWSTKV